MAKSKGTVKKDDRKEVNVAMAESFLRGAARTYAEAYDTEEEDRAAGNLKAAARNFVKVEGS